MEMAEVTRWLRLLYSDNFNSYPLSVCIKQKRKHVTHWYVYNANGDTIEQYTLFLLSNYTRMHEVWYNEMSPCIVYN